MTGLFCYEVKYKSISWTFSIMVVMHNFLFVFYLQLVYHVYIKCKHATPASIHTEVTWSSLNNYYCEDTVILLN